MLTLLSEVCSITIVASSRTTVTKLVVDTYTRLLHRDTQIYEMHGRVFTISVFPLYDTYHACMHACKIASNHEYQICELRRSRMIAHD